MEGDSTLWKDDQRLLEGVWRLIRGVKTLSGRDPILSRRLVRHSSSDGGCTRMFTNVAVVVPCQPSIGGPRFCVAAAWQRTRRSASLRLTLSISFDGALVGLGEGWLGGAVAESYSSGGDGWEIGALM
jgi:hypothetical protein